MRKNPAPEPAPSFEQRLEELETVVARLEAPELPLEQSMALFERGMKLSEECRRQLAEAEMKVEMLLERGGAAAPVDFEPEQEG